MNYVAAIRKLWYVEGYDLDKTAGFFYSYNLILKKIFFATH